jgi:hypothetical protein
VSKNPNITWQIVKNRPSQQWDWNAIIKNPRVIADIVQLDLPKFQVDFARDHNIELDWIAISMCVKIGVVREYPKLPWDWNALSQNPNITWQIIKRNLRKPWNWENVSRNPSVNIEIIEDTRYEYPWSYYHVSANPTLTWQFVSENLDKKMSFVQISKNHFGHI